MTQSRLRVVWGTIGCLATTSVAAQEDARLAVRVDSARHEVILTVGPFELSSMKGHEGHRDMPEFSARFPWPVTAMARGFSFALHDSTGKKVPQRVLHHLNLINTTRRQLLLPLQEKVMAIGRETKNIMLPGTVGLPLEAGTRMKVAIMWHNQTPVDFSGVMLTLHIRYTPDNLVPRPVTVLPISMDLADRPGAENSFPVPVGLFTISREFMMPVTGRLLAATGHMHDWATGLRLEDAASRKTLVSITPILDSTGGISDMPLRLFGVRGDGLKLHAGRRYRLVATYDNRSGATMDGMAMLGGIFSPSDLRDWPDRESEDIAYLDHPVPAPAADTTHAH
ncbi:MAG: hypothetical protein OEW80_10745 [Gemmatimonadota bacterium]|nr:hypothetical protein [Gemmatimonadota bacterium]